MHAATKVHTVTCSPKTPITSTHNNAAYLAIAMYTNVTTAKLISPTTHPHLTPQSSPPFTHHPPSPLNPNPK